MTYIGVPVIKQVSDSLVRVTGVSLDNAQDGNTNNFTIGLFENTVVGLDVRLPAGFKPRDYDLPDLDGKVTLQDSCSVLVELMGPQGRSAINVIKTGTTPEDFVILIDDAEAFAEVPQNTGELGVYIRFH